jgi:hypothetical protein
MLLSIRPRGYNRPVRGTVKILVVAATAGLAALAVLILYVGARRRGLEAHCRNNLRHLGALAASNWQAIPTDQTGRAFWQAVRLEQYRTKGAKPGWLPPYAPQEDGPRDNPRDPFLCPVHGRTLSNPGDPAAIDFLGPRTLREQDESPPKAEPIGADRPGNHPSGGHVLRVDGTVRPVSSIVERAGPSDPAWTGLDKFLKD